MLLVRVWKEPAGNDLVETVSSSPALPVLHGGPFMLADRSIDAVYTHGMKAIRARLI